MKNIDKIIAILILLISCTSQKSIKTNNNFVLLSGELGSTSVILQCRFASSDTLLDNDMPGLIGRSCFQVSSDSLFNRAFETEWIESNYNNDFSIKLMIGELVPNTRFYYRAKAEIEEFSDTQYSRIGKFKTLPDSSSEEDISFAMATGFNYEKFYGITNNSGRSKSAISSIDVKLGFEAFETIEKLNVNFFIANGDVVYYDKPGKQMELWAKNKDEMRAKWHRYFTMPRNRDMCLEIPVYYLKDDHDYRFNDCDTTNQKYSDPPHQLGIDIFREQVPIVDPKIPFPKTYRTQRIGKYLQLWFMEGRDYRSPNSMKDTKDKTIWGEEQKKWLKTTLLKSDAAFKILVSPTPMIGPDDAYKKDNHTNNGGFQYEGNEIFNWLIKNKFNEKNFYIICGDRHWQYHSVHPNGLEEFSSGAFIDQNSRRGRLPGDPKSTDPEALISVPYIQYDKLGGGFLMVKTYVEDSIPTIKFSFHDINGNELYFIKKQVKSIII